MTECSKKPRINLINSSSEICGKTKGASSFMIYLNGAVGYALLYIELDRWIFEKENIGKNCKNSTMCKNIGKIIEF